MRDLNPWYHRLSHDLIWTALLLYLAVYTLFQLDHLCRVGHEQTFNIGALFLKHLHQLLLLTE